MRSRPLLATMLLTVVMNVAAAAEITDWHRVAGEGQTFTLAVPKQVTYCNPGVACIAPRLLLAGVHGCSNQTFGPDPYPNVEKECRVEPGPTAPAGPLCFPDPGVKLKVKTLEVDPVQFGSDSNLSVYTCEKPDGRGYKNETWLWTYSKIANYLIAASVGLFNETAAREHCNTKCVAPTAEVQERALKLATPFLATAEVSAGSTPGANRSVYGLNADGTRNTTAIPNAKIGAGQPCDIGDRLPGTSYYSVAGRPNSAVDGSYPPLGASVYALCTFKAPVGVNK
jgi:hypothetical protein